MRRGRIITWSIPNDFEISTAELETLGCSRINNSPKTILKNAVDITKKKLFIECPDLSDRELQSKKVKRISVSNKINDKRGQILAAPYLNESGDYSVANLLLVEVDSRGRLSFTKKAELTDEKFEQLCDEISAEYRRLDGVVTADVFRGKLVNFIKDVCHGVNLRESGGIYFVDESQNDKYELLKTLFDANTQLQLISMPVYNDDDTIQSVGICANRELELEIEKLEVKFQDAIDKGVKPKGFERRRDEYAQLVEKLEVYRNDLHDNFKKHDTRIQTTLKVLENKFTTVDGLVERFDLAREMLKISTASGDADLARQLSEKLGDLEN